LSNVATHRRSRLATKWNFALGVLFALGSTGQLDDQQLQRYEARIQTKARRLHGLDQVS
jgi:hypothetical protein